MNMNKSQIKSVEDKILKSAQQLLKFHLSNLKDGFMLNSIILFSIQNFDIGDATQRVIDKISVADLSEDQIKTVIEWATKKDLESTMIFSFLNKF